MSPEENLRKQIQDYRDRIFDICASIHFQLIDKKLDFPREDMSEYDKGYEQGLRDYAEQIRMIKEPSR